MRLGTANTYDNTLANLTDRQAGLADLQEKLSAGKKVVRASDDPTGAAQAERAMSRISRIETEQRALSLQINAVTAAESTLGDATGLLQDIRDLVISAGNAGYSSVNRTTIAQEMIGLRDQLFAYANKQDSNGIPLFGSLGSSNLPFTDATSGVIFNGIPGQRAGTTVSIPGAMDGQAVWMNVPTGNGVYSVALGGTNAGRAWSDQGQVVDPSLVTGDNYTLTFTVDTTVTPNITTYDVVNTTAGGAVLSAQPFKDGQSIQFDGLSFTARGIPATGDSLEIAPSVRSNLFKVLDDAIAGIKGASNSNTLTQAITLALTQIDTGMERVQSARGQAGDLLKRADNIASNQQVKSDQVTTDRSRAEDMDMVKGISDFQNQQTGYDAALKTYAQVQRLSLFNYLG